MRSLQPKAILAAAALLAAIPAAALAQNTAAPVSVAACQAYAGQPLSPVAFINTGITSGNLGSYTIGFVNEANVAANHVGLDVSYAGSTQRVDERGTFAPNTRIDKTITGLSFLGYSGSDSSCSVAEVDFVDGTSWHAVPVTALNTTALSGVANR